MFKSKTLDRKRVAFSLVLFSLFIELGRGDSGTASSAIVQDTKNCSASNCLNVNGTSIGFTPPQAIAMSRLMPTSQHLLSNDTKDSSASNIDIVTSQDESLSSFSKFSSNSFNPSPFLGVISEAHVNNYPQGMAVGEVFPDTVGDRHLGGHKFLYGIAGGRTPHTGHSYLDQVTQQRPSTTTTTTIDIVESVVPSNGVYPTSDTFKPTDQSSFPSLTYPPTHQASSFLSTSSKSLGYPTFEIPDRFKEFNEISNAVSDYKPPSPIVFPTFDKPIKEEILDDRPFGPNDRPDIFPVPGVPGSEGFGPGSELSLPNGPSPGMLPPPIGGPTYFNKNVGYKKGGKWNGFFKTVATLVPLGILLAALTPNLLVVNSTEDPAAPIVQQGPPDPQGQLYDEWTKIPTWNPTQTAKTAYRSLDSPAALLAPPEIPLRTFNMTQCQKKKVCEALAEVDDSDGSIVDSLISRLVKL